MAKPPNQVDVLVLGEHPSAYLAAVLLRQSDKLKVMHSTIPAERSIERLVIVNPKFYSLHKLLEPLKRKIDSTAIHGLQFLGDQPDQHSEFRSKAAVVSISSYQQIRDTLAELAHRHGVLMAQPRSLDVELPDEQGMKISVGGQSIHAKVLVVAGELPTDLRRPLGIANVWDRALVQRYTFVSLPGNAAELTARPTLPMSLDLDHTLAWAWLLQGRKQVQLAIQQPLSGIDHTNPHHLLRHWMTVLERHGLLRHPQSVPQDRMRFLDLPAAAALEVDGVANRTLLIGPAGGFYSACGEDIYPTCWSAIHAVEIIRKALKQPHLQDALNPYRDRWRTSLGEYLRGPRQNLRFLLPLVYKNQTMANRLAESILQGKSLIR